MGGSVMLNIVSTGPGKIEHMSLEAIKAIEKSEVIIGYKKYVELIEELITDQKVIMNGMKHEVDRCKMALEHARMGLEVSIVSGGDAGIYGIAGIMQEIILEEEEKVDIAIDVQVIPGISSAHAAASSLGAPIVHDSVFISLSNLLTDLELIKKRLHAAGMGDFVTCIYNPKSKGRPDFIDMAREILLEYKQADTPVGIVKNAKRIDEKIIFTNLNDMCKHNIDMSTMVIVGNQDTYIKNKRMITPRGYRRTGDA
jgi:precorrin-3B C17-methyltransferase